MATALHKFQAEEEGADRASWESFLNDALIYGCYSVQKHPSQLTSGSHSPPLHAAAQVIKCQGEL